MMPLDPTVGGTVLRRAAIQSPNYVAGVSGWAIFANGDAEFNSITLPSGTSVQVFRQPTAPIGTIATGSLWLNTAAGSQVNYWDGTEWEPVTQDAADVLTPGSITAALLVAGMVVAGIVDGTTVEGATFISSVDLVYNGTPVADNLLYSQTSTAFTDPYGNQVPAGTAFYSSTSPGAAYLIEAMSGESWTIYNADGVNSQQGAWTVDSRWWQDATQFYVSTPIVTQQPGAAADTPETWHTIAPAGSWTVINPLQYTLYEDSTAGIRGELTATAAIASGATLMTLPAGYVPTTEARLTWNYNTSAPAVTTVLADVSTAGVIKTYAGIPSGATLNISGRIPLN
ncbi:MAG TPA: hypothetical protein VGG75_42685 [Trebonia sp.]|jgi:hypothetical protein